MTPPLKRHDGTAPNPITRAERNRYTLEALARIQDSGTRNINVQKDEAILAYEVALRNKEEQANALALDLQQVNADAEVEANKNATLLKGYREIIGANNFAHQAFVNKVQLLFDLADAHWDPRTTQNADMRRLRRALAKETS